MKRIPADFLRLVAILAMMPALAATALAAPPQPPAMRLRPPAVPLVTSNPSLSIWSEADRLTGDVTRHWTHHPHSLEGLIRVDGKTQRLMGAQPKEMPAMPQVGLRVLPTRTIYDFDDSHVHVTLTFMTAALPDDLEVLARPVTYLTWQVRAVDGAAHAVSLYQSTSAELVVNVPEQRVVWERETIGELTAEWKPTGELSVLRIGTLAQPVLETMGDNVRIDWGYAYAAAPRSEAKAAIGASPALIWQFIGSGRFPAKDQAQVPCTAGSWDLPAMAFAIDLGRVAAEPVSRHVMLAYDEVYSIEYFGAKLRPYWRRNGATPANLLQAAERDYPRLVERCAAFDAELMADLTQAGGQQYAQIAALAYRQCLAACGLAADAKGQPLLFTKENTSNGDIATVDVIYPMAPMLLWVSPTLAKASLAPVLCYAASDHWKFPNAPHDLGTYPVAMGRPDGGEGMPVEESGNMLLLCDALAQIDGNADFAGLWWPQLTQWARYLERYGLDPENQLCTDDFMGHLAHNANLSVKAILALAAYGDMCRRLRGDAAAAKKYRDLARADAQHWLKVADEGDHSRLAFDKPGTWSQKYNLVWDRVLGLDVFPADVARREIAYYKTVVQPYGVPLDSRTRLTKTDWSLWSATLAQKQSDFEQLVAPIYRYLDTTTVRNPLVDSYTTDRLTRDGFFMHARPVVGGIFIKMLADRAAWKKWTARDTMKPGPWAPLP